MTGEFTFAASDGRAKIFVRRREPEVPALGIVLIVHGIAEHSGRYLPFMDFLADNGFVSVCFDLIGHGKSVISKEKLGCVPPEGGGWNFAVNDMKKLHDMLYEERPELPFYIFGHSMGSFLTRTYLIDYPYALDGAILCGTGQPPAFLVGTGIALSRTAASVKGTANKSRFIERAVFGGYNKAFKPARTDYDWLSRDAAEVDKYVADPLCGFVPSAGLFRDMMGGIKYISSAKNHAAMNKDLKVLFISGAMDPVGENGKGVSRTYSLFKKAGMKNISMRIYEDCRHELLNELNKTEVMDDVLAWLLKASERENAGL